MELILQNAHQYLISIYTNWYQEILMFCVMLIFSAPFILLIPKLLFSIIKNYLIAQKKAKFAKLLKRSYLYRYLLHSCLSLYIMFWGSLFEVTKFFTPFVINIKNIFVTSYVSISLTLLTLSAIDLISDVYMLKKEARHAPITLHTQILKVIIVSATFLIILSEFFNLSLSTLFTGLGAAAAILTYVFKDTLLGLMTSLQLTFQDIIRIGDWITIPQFDIDGDVEEITISVVKIRNFDKTISTIPTHSLLSTNIKNWRAMKEAGGRRIKRSISIDIDTIKFCSKELLKKMKKKPYLEDFLSKNEGNKLTNIGVFRQYVMEYLKRNKAIYTKNFTFMVRQLEPTSTGLPIELYIFSKETNWVKYEAIQADIFDHLLSIIQEFDLRAFQRISTKGTSVESSEAGYQTLTTTNDD